MIFLSGSNNGKIFHVDVIAYAFIIFCYHNNASNATILRNSLNEFRKI